MTSQLFSAPSQVAKEVKRYGNVYNGRYHMPLLPGEVGPKDGSPHVSRGCQRMTNLVGAFEDTRALSIWEQAMGLVGLALDEALYEELVVIIGQARSEGVDFTRLRDYPDLKSALAGHIGHQASQEASIIGRAKDIAGSSVAARRGTNRHTAWEHRGQTGEWLGTKGMQEQLEEVERLLAENGLQRIPDLQERVVRNTVINAVGRFDDILLEVATGRLLMADLKTKATPFFSYMAVDAQLAGYAYSHWMLSADGLTYEDGPIRYVDLTEGVILHAPSDGSPAALERADLELGWKVCQLAVQILELRTVERSAGRMARAAWMPRNNLEIAS